jgi:hypothetical protein
MSLDLSPEQEQIVDHAIRAGLIHLPMDVIAIGIGVLRERLAAQKVPHAEFAEDEWERELHDWIHSHSSAGPVLTDDAVERESIYRTRGV